MNILLFAQMIIKLKGVSYSLLEKKIGVKLFNYERMNETNTMSSLLFFFLIFFHLNNLNNNNK